ncbi:MAG TPA: L-serine ammonia-lyase [Woeseiaceae bacterium]
MAATSIFEIFKIGVGPSSSHTVGPMRAARKFALNVRSGFGLESVGRMAVNLYGSLALTGRGHASDTAILLGLSGEEPERIDPDMIPERTNEIRETGRLRLLDEHEIPFNADTDLVFLFSEHLERHTNGMRFSAYDSDGKLLLTEDYFSLGGGFIARNDEPEQAAFTGNPPYMYRSGKTLLALAHENGLTIDELVHSNETFWQTAADVDRQLDEIWVAMEACIRRGMSTDGVLPGRLGVRRRAARMFRSLNEKREPDSMDTVDWVNTYAIAVNEENAAGGRVVTSPTNGAAGIIPAVILYYKNFVSGSDQAGIRRFLLAAGAIGILYKMNASISGAEMGCQGEVGVACSMAAAGLVAARGGKNWQVENAAEIGMEHNLGLTCDPIGGLVQIPCIERNAMGAMKAINAARLAMHGDGTHKVSLDQVIETMRQTGLDMSHVYKETSKGGLAVNVPEC